MTSTPPDPNYRPPAPAGPARLSWRLAHSTWVLAPILSFGCLSAAGFLYVGLRAGRPAWWIPGVCYSVVATAGFFLGADFPKDSIGQNITYGVFFSLWLASIVHALVINPSWLRWRANYQPWYAQPQQTMWAGPSGPAPVNTPLPAPIHGLVPPPQQFYGTPASMPTPQPMPYSPPAPSAYPLPEPMPYSPPVPAAYPVPEPSPYSPPSPAPAPMPPERVDVNTATEQQLALLPGFDRHRAARVVAQRQIRGGFTDLNEFAAAATLAPHEFVAIRVLLNCSTPPRRPTTGQAEPYGRIVDV